MSMNPSPNSEPEPLNEAIDEALEGNLRASQWSELRGALSQRRERIQRDFDRCEDADEKILLRERLEEIDEQISVLAEEESITRFVEDTVKFSYEVRQLNQG